MSTSASEPIGNVGHHALVQFFGSEITRPDSYFHVIRDVNFVGAILDAVHDAHTFICDCCKRICGAKHSSMDELCPECVKLARCGAFSKVWRPEAIPEVAARVMELFNDPQQLFEVRRELNIRIRWETRNRPKRLMHNSDLGIPKGWKCKPRRKYGKDKSPRPHRSGRPACNPIIV